MFLFVGFVSFRNNYYFLVIQEINNIMSNFKQIESSEKGNHPNSNRSIKGQSQFSLENKKDEKKNRRKSMRKRLYTERYNNGYWNDQQNAKYCQFLKKNQHLFEMNPRYRKIAKIHVLMSKHVKTRSSDQCRSHHQKMLKFHGNILSTIAHIENFLSIQPTQNIQPIEPIQPKRTEFEIQVKVEEQVKYPFMNYRYYEFNPYLVGAVEEEWKYPVNLNSHVHRPEI